MRSWTLSCLLFFGCALGGLSSGCGRREAPSTLKATWAIVAAADGDPQMAPMRRCEDFGVTSIQFNVDTQQLFEFPCTAYKAETPSFPSGYYSIHAMAFDAAGKVLAKVDFEPNRYIYGPTDLGELRFSVR